MCRVGVAFGERAGKVAPVLIDACHGNGAAVAATVAGCEFATLISRWLARATTAAAAANVTHLRTSLRGAVAR